MALGRRLPNAATSRARGSAPGAPCRDTCAARYGSIRTAVVLHRYAQRAPSAQASRARGNPRPPRKKAETARCEPAPRQFAFLPPATLRHGMTHPPSKQRVDTRDLTWFGVSRNRPKSGERAAQQRAHPGEGARCRWKPGASDSGSAATRKSIPSRPAPSNLRVPGSGTEVGGLSRRPCR
jgi:hypothetical protein